MFDCYGPHGAEEEREPTQADWNEVPDGYEEKESHTGAEVLPPVQEPYGPAVVPPEILPEQE